MIRPSGKLKRFISNADYQVSTGDTKKNDSRSVRALTPALTDRRHNFPEPIAQTLLPLHLSFCRTTLKNDASGIDASGRVFFALRTLTIDPRSTWMGLRPSNVR